MYLREKQMDLFSGNTHLPRSSSLLIVQQKGRKDQESS